MSINSIDAGLPVSFTLPGINAEKMDDIMMCQSHDCEFMMMRLKILIDNDVVRKLWSF